MIIPSTKQDLVGIKFMNAKEPNKTLSPAQEDKLNQATEAMQEVAEFIKRND